ncbi:MAG: ferrous iron transport protein B [Muribaculaceae bacterium]|nr:ferrous iron transport protein B [Muribaculaceae bacterium]
MLLSELKTGERAIVVKVLGHGGFRKRIIEMGFIKGKTVEAVLNAPLQDPVKYKIMGYELSLRHDEAAMIQVVSEEEIAREYGQDASLSIPSNGGEVVEVEAISNHLKEVATRKRRTINVALVGNPNSGKTSLFNFASGATEHVGNYSGVTVDAKEGKCQFEGYTFNIVDLPGTYSLTAYSPEELYVRKQIIEKTPDVIINVVDASNLERNLYLTTQLIDMDLRMVCALNMYDDLERKGDKLDTAKLGQLLGVPMIPTVFKTGKGVDLLFHIIINLYEGVDYIDENGNINPEVAQEIQNWHKEYGKEEIEHEEDFASGGKVKNNVFRHIHINHGNDLEEAITKVKMELEKNTNIRHRYSLRYLAIKLLENDADAELTAKKLPNGADIIAMRDLQAKRIKENTLEDSESAIMNAKYGFINGALKEVFFEGNNPDAHQVTKILDDIVTHRLLGFPLFFLFLWFMFWVTFTLGQYPMDWIDAGVGWLKNVVETNMPAGPLKAMIADGVIGGVGSVIVFLPQILILYFFISIMEDSGYMARAAFIMDKLMHGMGLHGKSFIPMIMGFGCNVPAIMATRTIESRNSRLITMLVLPFMSCSARLPIYIMIIGTFFATNQSLIMLSLYAIGIVVAILMSRVLKRFLIKNDDTPFVMELPPYRFPTGKAIWRHTWSKGKQYLKKMGGIILVASIIVWFLGYYPNHDAYQSSQEQQEHSYLGMIGKTIEPVFKPNGFDWKLDVGLLAGVGAKEIVASTLGVIYSNDESFADDEQVSSDSEKYSNLNAKMTADGITPLAAFSFLLFVLLYFPCIATIAAIKGETGSWRWALFAAFYTTAVAWIVSALVFQLGSLF